MSRIVFRAAGLNAAEQCQNSSSSSRTALRRHAADRSGCNPLPQPRSERGGIETHRTADLEGGNAVLGGELVHLPLGNTQEFGYVGDGEGGRSHVKRVREIHGLLPRIFRQSTAINRSLPGDNAAACQE